jgi:hypothetical protein
LSKAAIIGQLFGLEPMRALANVGAPSVSGEMDDIERLLEQQLNGRTLGDLLREDDCGDQAALRTGVGFVRGLIHSRADDRVRRQFLEDVDWSPTDPPRARNASKLLREIFYLSSFPLMRRLVPGFESDEKRIGRLVVFEFEPGLIDDATFSQKATVAETCGPLFAAFAAWMHDLQPVKPIALSRVLRVAYGTCRQPLTAAAAAALPVKQLDSFDPALVPADRLAQRLDFSGDGDASALRDIFEGTLTLSLLAFQPLPPIRRPRHRARRARVPGPADTALAAGQGSRCTQPGTLYLP